MPFIAVIEVEKGQHRLGRAPSRPRITKRRSGFHRVRKRRKFKAAPVRPLRAEERRATLRGRMGAFRRFRTGKQKIRVADILQRKGIFFPGIFKPKALFFSFAVARPAEGDV